MLTWSKSGSPLPWQSIRTTNQSQSAARWSRLKKLLPLQIISSRFNINVCHSQQLLQMLTSLTTWYIVISTNRLQCSVVSNSWVLSIILHQSRLFKAFICCLALASWTMQLILDLGSVMAQGNSVEVENIVFCEVTPTIKVNFVLF